ncbi:ATP-dependent 26S proteasome regulatory subunit [Serratia sp. BIGb0234]|uniref:ATP-binding protein n=1 Tax=Serratia sp. BIGb0234 TaxID=2940614 RepID=UPI002167DCD4|nr:ATP-binding protein [Serratia sp. BIGb0234]MCS4320817.1 ATP-dependent 26S proteasome regulatory subunit [Serratia sp. BIGb0234]
MVKIASDSDDSTITNNGSLSDFLTAVVQVEDILQQACYRFQDTGEFEGSFTPEPNEETPLATIWEPDDANWTANIPEFTFSPDSRIAYLWRQFDLSYFELAVLILGCLYRLSPRCGSVFNLLQSGRHERPGLSFALRLFCPGQLIRNIHRACLLPTAPLIRYGLLEVFPERNGNRAYQTSDMVYHYLLGSDTLPETLHDQLEWLLPRGELELDTTPLIDCWYRERAHFPPLLELRVVAGMSGQLAAATIAQQMSMRALLLNPAVLNVTKDRTLLLRQVVGAAKLHSALLVLPEIDDHRGEERSPSSWECLLPLLKDYLLPVCVLVSSSSSATPLPSLSRWVLPVTLPAADKRMAQMQWELQSHPHAGLDFPALVQRVALSQVEISAAVLDASVLRRQRGSQQIEMVDMQQALLRRARKNFTHLAQRFSPTRTMNDVIIDDGLQEQMDEILCAIRQRDRILEQGFSRKLGRATGISALFHGDPGTGKTLLAEVLANQLGVDLIRVDLSTVVNKYIGETEKNLAQIFDLAAQDAGVLFFDEADALFGKRSETKDAKDRHANIEIAYLLQRLESHPGLVVLATNHRSHLDDAFSRRFTFIVRFSYPDTALRKRMWQSAWPPGIQVADDVDYEQLAQTALTGANIRNIALLASWLAAESPCVTVEHIQRALRRELSKIGRLPG